MTTEDKKKIVKAKLPKGWSNTTLQDVSVITMGQSPKGEYTTLESNYTPLVGGAADLKNKSIQPSKYTKKPTRLCKVGDIIVCVRATIGRASVADKVYCLGRGVAGFTPLCDRDWLLFFFEAFEQNLTNLGKGVTFVQIDKKSIQEFPVALPPLNEQKRIVAKIEELFSELDAGEQSLRDARQQLTLYRQSLLKQAFEGKLTETWRANNPDKLEAPETLLARIQQERESRHQQQLQDWQQAVEQWEQNAKEGKKPTKPRKAETPDKPSSEHIKRMWNLPNTWQWIQVGYLSFVTKLAGFEYTKFVTYEEGSGIPVIKAENAGKEGFKRTAFSEVPLKTVNELPRSELTGGELLVVFVGAGTGNVSIVPSDRKYFLGPNIGMARPYNQQTDSRFIELYLRSPMGKDLLLAASKAVAQPSLSMGTIRQAPVAIPSLPEQQEIVLTLDEQFTAIEQNEKEIDHALAQSQALRQSILKKAFNGKL